MFTYKQLQQMRDANFGVFSQYANDTIKSLEEDLRYLREEWKIARDKSKIEKQADRIKNRIVMLKKLSESDCTLNDEGRQTEKFVS